VSALFWLVVRWISAILIGVAVGSAGAVLGFGSVTMLAGAIALPLGGVFLVAGITGAIVVLLSLGADPAERRRLR